MQPTIEMNRAAVYLGDCLELLPLLPDNSIDSIVTDPPYELGFMGKSWDSTGIAYNENVWRNCLRVLKPGGHLLAFGGTRTWHRLAVAIEDAGFEIRDNIAWLYGSGFPKSHNISKAIDKLHGAEREVIGKHPNSASSLGNGVNMDGGQANQEFMLTEPATDDAKAWDGWGTALKPAHEPIVVARKPLIGTVAENVLAWGVGGLNIDASRIGFADETDKNTVQNAVWYSVPNETYGRFEKQSLNEIMLGKNSTPNGGRWPANIILDETTAELLDEQTANLKGATSMSERVDRSPFSSGQGELVEREVYGDSGGASRFFYVAKANKRDRNEGLEASNTHPTVKPTALMTYLIKLVTPPHGTVLDPFTGSGSTGKAAILNGFKFIGLELTEEYIPIIKSRLQQAENEYLNQIF